MPCISCVIFVENTLRYSLEHFLRKDTKQLPTDVQRLKHCPILVNTCKRERERERSVIENVQVMLAMYSHTLCDEVLLELLKEL